MKFNLAGMNGCHDLSNYCVIIVFILFYLFFKFIFSRLEARAYFLLFIINFLFLTYVVVSGRDYSFAIIFIIILTSVGWWQMVFIQ